MTNTIQIDKYLLNSLIGFDKAIEDINSKIALTKKIIQKGDDIFSGDFYEVYKDEFLIATVQEYRCSDNFYDFTEYGKQLIKEIILDYVLTV